MVEKIKLDNLKNKMDNLNITSIEFEKNDEDENNHSKTNNLTSSIITLDNLNESLNAHLSQSVFDLVNCCICLSPVEEPLTCPKCNNFACKKCLEMYFGNKKTKKCPLCKENIEIREMKENSIIKEIEKILNKSENNKNKFLELSRLIEQKKNEWENEHDNIKSLIEKSNTEYIACNIKYTGNGTNRFITEVLKVDYLTKEQLPYPLHKTKLVTQVFKTEYDLTYINKLKNIVDKYPPVSGIKVLKQF